mmetsp:Transcript_3693/g.5458  ORF Transcript_3693/g.5458 Transcript_3693/m.5458 type:complete len:1191 (-) Transcript_3693:9-3581(-)
MFVYLSKKINIPKGNKLHSVSWNTEHGWLACGAENGLLKVLKLEQRNIAAPNEITMNQTLEGHSNEVTLVSWNEDYRKLTSSDSTGLIVVWTLHQGKWIEEMINNRNKSSVKAVKWTSDGFKICIVYADGMVIVGTVSGDRLWGKVLNHQLTHMEWSPDGKFVLFGTEQGKVLVYDCNTGDPKHEIKLYCRDDTQKGSQIIGIKWYDGSQGYDDLQAPTLAICYANGKCQLMRYELDVKPVLIDTGMDASNIDWNTNGTVLAIGGMQEVVTKNEKKKMSVVQFYSPLGRHLRTLRTPGGTINGLSWEGTGLRLAVAVDSLVFFAVVRPDYKWGYSNDTLIYAFTKWERPEHCVIFYNTVTEERSMKYVKRLLSIKSAGERCLLVTRNEEKLNSNEESYVLIVCNLRGLPTKLKVINVEPKYVHMDNTHIIVASDSQVFVWNYNYNQSVKTDGEVPVLPKLSDKPTLRNEDDDEYLFHIDDTSFKTRRPTCKGETEDAVVCLTTNMNQLLIARESGTLHLYSLPNISLCSKFILKCRPQQLSFNCDNTKLSVIDINGVFTMYSLEMKITVKKNKQKIKQLASIQKLDIERKECWDMKWASDNPELFSLMEKDKLYVFRNTSPEEPKLYSGFLCEFNELRIKGVLLDQIMKDPENPQKNNMIAFETKSLRDTKMLLDAAGIEDAYSFIQDNPHPILWSLLAEASLEKLDFKIATRAFVEYEDYRGIQFVKYLKTLNDVNLQNAEVAAYFGHFNEAEQIYRDIDRKPLAIDLRKKVGGWFAVLQLLRDGDGNDDLMNEAYNAVGDYYAERQRWNQAVKHYLRARNYEQLVECYERTESYNNLAKLITILPTGSPLLLNIGQKFASVGIIENAIKAYLRAGEIETAINSCVELNQWDKAVELAQKNNFPGIETLLFKYANHLVSKGRLPEAVELFQKAHRNTEAAKLLTKLARTAGQDQKKPQTAKKLYVMAGLEVDKFRTTILDKGMSSTGDTNEALRGLVEHDLATGFDKSLDNAWHGAEAYHYYLLAQRQLYKNNIPGALITSLRLMAYDDVLTVVDIYSLIALASYLCGDFVQCSKAFSKLESTSDFNRDRFESLAISIFQQHSPSSSSSSVAMVRCPHCDSSIPAHSSKCSHCSASLYGCLVTGQVVSNTKYWECGTCRHRALSNAVYKLKYCPLCHTKRKASQKSSKK